MRMRMQIEIEINVKYFFACIIIIGDRDSTFARDPQCTLKLQLGYVSYLFALVTRVGSVSVQPPGAGQTARAAAGNRSLT